MRMLKNRELAVFCNQFSMILKSGISAIEGLSLLLEEAQTEEEKVLLQSLYDEMNQTGTLAPAFEKTKQFPSYFVHMIRIGEETGTLDEVIASLEHHYEREAMISDSIRNALTYPLIMIGMIFFIILLLLTKVMPIFDQVFTQLGYEMNGIAKGFLSLGNIISDYIFVVIFAAALVAYGVYYCIKKKSNLKPIISASRFSSCMALALKSGLIPERGFEFAEEVIDDEVFLKKIASAKKAFDEGASLPSALQSASVFTGTYARLLSIANKTGSMDDVMGELSDKYEEELHAKITSFIATLEPTLVIILSCIVGMILFAVMFPLMGLMSGL